MEPRLKAQLSYSYSPQTTAQCPTPSASPQDGRTPTPARHASRHAARSNPSRRPPAARLGASSPGLVGRRAATCHLQISPGRRVTRRLPRVHLSILHFSSLKDARARLDASTLAPLAQETRRRLPPSTSATPWARAREMLLLAPGHRRRIWTLGRLLLAPLWPPSSASSYRSC
uniref:Uncharacterized protein n=1 Tax=Arundo donax TaxID=35708 RepID=A0A0A9BWY7_ARUDO